jgi:phosphopantetheine--protein transferase-like protein
MKWSFNTPTAGDAIRVKINEIYHYGIYVSEDEIIQFGLPPCARRQVKQQDITVCVSNVETFLQGGFLECGKAEKKDGKKRANKEIVEYAKGQLGRAGYHILNNNCEHFVYECLFGQKRSLQTDDVRAFFSNLPIADVYTFAIPNDYSFSTLYPDERQEEIEGVSNLKVKEEKYFVWKLLEYALMRTYGYKINKLNFSKSKEGKWLLKECYISLSHSNGIVAVALSKKPIGVDIEVIEKPKNSAIERVLVKKEAKEYEKAQDKNGYLLTAWSKKESAFKCKGKGKFTPSKINTIDYDFFEKTVALNGREYILTVCSEYSKTVRYFEVSSLE